MTNLIPTVITDRNGRRTTVYRAPRRAPKTTRSAPAFTPPPRPSARTHDDDGYSFFDGTHIVTGLTREEEAGLLEDIMDDRRRYAPTQALIGRFSHPADGISEPKGIVIARKDLESGELHEVRLDGISTSRVTYFDLDEDSEFVAWYAEHFVDPVEEGDEEPRWSMAEVAVAMYEDGRLDKRRDVWYGLPGNLG